MSLQNPSAVPSQLTQVNRPLAHFPPSYWGDRFLHYHFDPIAHASKEKEAEKLREEVKKDLLKTADNPLEQLILIDEIQRLCVDNYFADEINEILESLYSNYGSYEDDDDDLYTVSLRFRLLRQQGYHISSEVFEKFKDQKGNFKECLINDVRGMLGLYDAAQLRIRGEDVLDKALNFTAAQLKKSLERNAIEKDSALEEQVRHALEQQMRKNIPRLEGKHYMMFVYPEMPSHNKPLLKLAKIEFNLLQSIHRKELAVITRYWKDLGIASKAPFARERVAECYFWAMTTYPEPENFLTRRISSITTSFLSLIDDIYDAFGVIHELKIFTQAIERWDISCIHQLPEYMKPYYEAFLDHFKYIEDEMEKQGTAYRFPYLKESMKNVVRGYMKEAQYLSDKYVPTVEEHRELSVVTGGYPTLITTAYVGLGNIVTKDTFEWLLTNPKIVEASSVVSRFVNDIVGHKDEQKRAHPPSSVECYMKQYAASQEEAYQVLGELVDNAWKDMNEELLKKPMPKPLLEAAINLARFTDVVYKDADNYTLLGPPIIKAITDILIDPVP